MKQSCILPQPIKFEAYKCTFEGIYYQGDPKNGGIDFSGQNNERTRETVASILLLVNKAYDLAYYHGFNAGVAAREKLMEKE